MLAAATEKGIALCVPGEDEARGPLALAGRDCTALAAHDGALLAGTTEGLFLSTDGARSWQPVVAGGHVRWLDVEPTAGVGLAGLEPAAILIASDGFATWRSAPGVAELRDRLGWYLPYSPAAGCVRDFAFGPGRCYAAVEVGGVLVAETAAASWRLAGGSTGIPSFGEVAPSHVHPDVHSLETHPDLPGALLAVTNSGLYYSTDGGDSFALRGAARYTRAAWIDPRNPDRWLAAPAEAVDRGGTVLESSDRGQTWRAATDGLGLPWPRDMIERFAHVGDQLYAIRADGEVYASGVDVIEWRRAFAAVPGVRALAPVARPAHLEGIP
jgi:hypothetical protein